MLWAVVLLFPLGFEESIPAHLKSVHEEKRRKLEKKKKLKLLFTCCKALPPSSHEHSGNDALNTDDIIEMACTLGLSFNGTKSELRHRTEKILLGPTP